MPDAWLVGATQLCGRGIHGLVSGRPCHKLSMPAGVGLSFLSCG